jgi:hypothetical protein
MDIAIHARNLEADMSKPSLRLVHRSDEARPSSSHRRRPQGFRPHIIQGGAISGYRPITALGFPVQFIGECLQISYESYLALLLTNLTVLSWAVPRRIQTTMTDSFIVDLRDFIPPKL